MQCFTDLFKAARGHSFGKEGGTRQAHLPPRMLPLFKIKTQKEGYAVYTCLA